jgi:hypothetical protein
MSKLTKTIKKEREMKKSRKLKNGSSSTAKSKSKRTKKTIIVYLRKRLAEGK